MTVSGRGLYWDRRFGRFYRIDYVEEKNYSGFRDLYPFETISSVCYPCGVRIARDIAPTP